MPEPYVTTETLDQLTEGWLAHVAPFNQQPMRLAPEKAALIVIDMQNFFLDPASPTFACGGLAILPRVRRLIDAFRAAGRPVIFTRHVHHPDLIDAGIMGWWWEGMCVEGSPESEVHEQIAPLPREKTIYKHRYSAFYNTDLDTVLRCQRIEDLVLCGVLTNLCCESTARDAYFRDYRVFFPADGTATINAEMHVASLLNLAFGFARVTVTQEVIGELIR